MYGKERLLRKKFALIAAGIAVGVGAGLGVTSYASAAVTVPSYYNSPEECNQALAAADAEAGGRDLHCEPTIGTSVPGPWVLVSGPSGG